MREILFRGKRFDNGKWEYGFYVVYPHPIGRPYPYIDGDHYIQTVPCNTKYMVVPETVCQYAGLADKNGKKIFEGDIVNVPLFSPPNMRIAFIDGAFCLADKDGEYVADIHYIHHAGIKQSEIVGNVFDNPELLEKIGCGGMGK